MVAKTAARFVCMTLPMMWHLVLVWQKREKHANKKREANEYTKKRVQKPTQGVWLSADSLQKWAIGNPIFELFTTVVPTVADHKVTNGMGSQI